MAVITTKRYRARNISDSYIVSPYYLRGRRTWKLIYTRRIDSYAGLCEIAARAKQIPPELCICNNIKEIELRNADLRDKLMSQGN